ncbi:type II toxin-antitoxin system VapC family toxin [Roseivirga sp. BDSF3-8]|uniref:type II toxin-antitoxin system VapC family toxin n=1 Tax=Roseivirga sp. BDSF3-8 TaxID=3241598 RepID=UPI003531910A
MNDQPGEPQREVYVCDTMALVLWLEERKLPNSILYIFSEVIHGRAKLVIPAMVLAEVGYLSEKKRIGLSLADVSLWADKIKTVRVAPVSGSVTQKAFIINDIPELHDRLIAATAAELNAPLLTNDPKIKASKFVNTIWNIPRNAQQKTRRLPESRTISSVRS